MLNDIYFGKNHIFTQNQEFLEFSNNLFKNSKQKHFDNQNLSQLNDPVKKRAE